ncbi:ubiquitin [Artemisia annua]|uniref:Ubiquitin n=1 Tax=Artemisia annua TaxID=35608 RepID=A0A2U1LQC3_ARTAN|nr:ubiquitin [Artemisia annua]
MQILVKTPATSNNGSIRDKLGINNLEEEEGAMKIFIRRVGQKTICLQGHKLKSYTICDVKLKLSKIKGFAPPYNQRLYFAGMLLENDMHRTLSEHNIYGGCTLDLVCALRGRRKIFVENGKIIIPLDDVFGYSTIREVKAMIQEKMLQADHHKYSSIKNLELVYGGEKLDDNLGVGYYYIQNESTLRLVDGDNPPMMEMMRIYVKIVAANYGIKTIDLQVKSSDTIENVRAKIQEKEDIPADKQLLFLPQTRLMDGLTLADYYIRNESTIHLIQILNC